MSRHRVAALVLVLAGFVLAVGAAHADKAPATCTVTPNPAPLGETVTFDASGLTGKNYLRVANTLTDELTISELGNAQTIAVAFTPPNAGVFLFDVYRDDESGNYFNTTAYYKCQVVATVTG
jgi:hypothetical protein